jgi:hypothetical protein
MRSMAPSVAWIAPLTMASSVLVGNRLIVAGRMRQVGGVARQRCTHEGEAGQD